MSAEWCVILVGFLGFWHHFSHTHHWKPKWEETWKNFRTSNSKCTHSHTFQLSMCRMCGIFTPVSTLCEQYAYRRYRFNRFESPLSQLHHISEELPHKYVMQNYILFSVEYKYIYSANWCGRTLATDEERVLMLCSLVWWQSVRWLVCAEGRRCIIITIFIGTHNRIIMGCECQEQESKIS